LAPRLKDDILQTSCNISVTCVDRCWETLKSTIWTNAAGVEDKIRAYHLFDPVSHTLYPLQQTCINASCLHNRTGRLLKKAEQRQAVLFTLDKGAIPARSVHLYFETCHTNYHHNFHVNNGIHTYYDGSIPDVIQVSEHQFTETRLIQLWITLMLISWKVQTSATNCAHLYNHTLSNTAPPGGDWAFGFTVTTEQVWDGFMILALLEDCKHWSKTLEVPHTGVQKDHFTHAVHA
ncbi:hypothetical protein L208DRAFT_1192433, partial [Tricholoma matsutake]